MPSLSGSHVVLKIMKARVTELRRIHHVAKSKSAGSIVCFQAVKLVSKSLTCDQAPLPLPPSEKQMTEANFSERISLKEKESLIAGY